MGLKKKYKDFKYGVINDIEASEIPHEAFVKADGMYYRENFWRNLPGLTELNKTAISSNPVWSVFNFYQLTPQKKIQLAACGSNILKFNEQTRLYSSIHSGMVPNKQVEFLPDVNQIYFGSDEDDWRRYDGGEKTYTVGNGDTAPKKFSKIIYNQYAQRYFGIGYKLQPNGLYFSEHIDDGGIETWIRAPQLIESVDGDYPLNMDLYEGNVTTISRNSITSGSVRGTPENWSFQREKAQAGTIAARTFKRYKDFFLYLTPSFDLMKWPSNEIVNKGRVKFYIDPNFAHLAVAEVIEDRYYVLCFKSAEAVSANKYHLWVYDILGDAFYGPSTQYNVVSMYYDRESRQLLCGGVDDLVGFVLEFRGRNIKNTAKKRHLVSAYSDYGLPEVEKRFNKGWIKAKQEGSNPNQVELIINTNNVYNNPQSQTITLEDPANQNLADTNAVKEAITKRFDIYEQYGLGNGIQYELRQETLNAELAFSELTIDYDLKDYEKENA